MNYASVPMQECTVAKICKQYCHEITDPREYSISLPSASASQDLGGVALSNANTSTIILIRKVYMIYYKLWYNITLTLYWYCHVFFGVSFFAPAHWLEASHLDTIMCNLGTKIMKKWKEVGSKLWKTSWVEWSHKASDTRTVITGQGSQRLRSPAALLSICSATSSLGQSQQSRTKWTAEAHQITPRHQLSTLH